MRGLTPPYTDGGPSPFLGDGEVLVRIGVKAREESGETRPDASLTFVIDVSGSMARDGRLELVKQSLKLLVDQMRPGERIGIVVFGDDARVVLPPTSAARGRGDILNVIDSLHPEGGRIGTVNVRWTDPDSRQATEISHEISVRDLSASFRNADPTLQLDALVAATAERLRSSPYARDYRLADVVTESEGARLPQTDDARGSLDLLASAAHLER